ncbi:hypothetical protein BJ546DRAFT_323740 [Cryomyces antarcticus]
MDEEQRISACKASVRQIYTMLHSSPNDWRYYIVTARGVIASIESTTFMHSSSRVAEQTWLVNGLQQLAYHDADNGNVPDVADWCTRQWLTILQRHPDNVPALNGIGQNWLSRAQVSLARIHRVEQSSSSSGGSSTRVTLSSGSMTGSEEERQASQAAIEAEARLHTADYVEARGILLPATEYLNKAVEAAQAQNMLTGDLLATTAEAYMSLGNVSYTRINEQYFHQAISYLRMATNVPGYSLSPHLQQYLDDYGRLME